MEFWLARQTADGTAVMVQIACRDIQQKDPLYPEQFSSEINAISKINHPNLWKIYDGGFSGSVAFRVGECTESEPLSAMLATKGSFLPEKEALRIIRMIADGLRYAWNGFKRIHRDISPDHILLTGEGIPKLLDIGMTQQEAAFQEVPTTTAMLVQDPHYMSPEQIRGNADIDFRSDVYELGATLYHLVTGHPPYDAPTAMGILAKHLKSPFPPPKEKNPSVSNECSALLEEMMEKDPEDRPRNWSAVISDIDRVILNQAPLSLQAKTNNAASAIRPPSATPGIAASGESVSLHSTRINVSKTGETQTFVAPKPVRASRLPLILVLTAVVVAVGLAVIIHFAGASRKPPSNPAKAPLQIVERTIGSRPSASPSVVASPVSETPPPSPPVTEPTRQEAATVVDNAEQANQAESAKRQEEAMKEDAAQAAERAKRQEEERLAAENLQKEQAEKKKQAERVRIAQQKAHDAAEKQRQIEEAEAQQAKVFDKIIPLLTERKFPQAAKSFDPEAESICPNVKPILEQLSGIDRMVLDSFKPDIGKPITIATDKGTRIVTIQKLEEDHLVIEEKMGNAVFRNRIPMRSLADAERLQRLSALSSEARAVFVGTLSLKAKDYANAAKQFQEAGSLSVPLLAQIEVVRYGKVEAGARADFQKIMLKTGIPLDAPSPAEIKKTIHRKRFNEVQKADLARWIKEYRAQHAASKYAKENDPVLDAVLEAINVPQKQ
jgi:serine/threonine protein kinase